MKKIGIDTNVVLSFLLKRLPSFKISKKLFADCKARKLDLFLPTVVFLETEWVLRSVYKQPKEVVTQLLEELILLEHLSFEDKEIVKFSLNYYKNSSQVSLTDCVIIKTIQNQGFDFVTFDKDLESLYQSLI